MEAQADDRTFNQARVDLNFLCSKLSVDKGKKGMSENKTEPLEKVDTQIDNFVENVAETTASITCGICQGHRRGIDTGRAS